MASLTLKNVPDDLLRALRRFAEEDRRSLTREIIHLLESSLVRRAERRPARRAPDVDAQLAAWRRLAGRWKSDADRATEAARLLERRSTGRKVDL